jgi:hypothetical protein
VRGKFISLIAYENICVLTERWNFGFVFLYHIRWNFGCVFLYHDTDKRKQAF